MFLEGRGIRRWKSLPEMLQSIPGVDPLPLEETLLSLSCRILNLTILKRQPSSTSQTVVRTTKLIKRAQRKPLMKMKDSQVSQLRCSFKNHQCAVGDKRNIQESRDVSDIPSDGVQRLTLQNNVSGHREAGIAGAFLST